ncbi:MAG TPA: hypothetical protein VFS10_18990 [Pyrinomonadaceae bacterium]|nr:hypothetical protein [Pyrinomonadaceae bacterium]
MDSTIIFTLVLSAFFLGGILWIVIHSRRQQSAVARARRAETPDGEDVPRPRAPDGEKTV